HGDGAGARTAGVTALSAAPGPNAHVVVVALDAERLAAQIVDTVDERVRLHEPARPSVAEDAAQRVAFRVRRTADDAEAVVDDLSAEPVHHQLGPLERGHHRAPAFVEVAVQLGRPAVGVDQ